MVVESGTVGVCEAPRVGVTVGVRRDPPGVFRTCKLVCAGEGV